jgi:hypothetical protein
MNDLVESSGDFLYVLGSKTSASDSETDQSIFLGLLRSTFVLCHVTHLASVFVIIFLSVYLNLIQGRTHLTILTSAVMIHLRITRIFPMNGS